MSMINIFTSLGDVQTVLQFGNHWSQGDKYIITKHH